MNPVLLQAITRQSFEDKIAKKKEGIHKAYQSILKMFEKFCITKLDNHIEFLVDDLSILKKEN